MGINISVYRDADGRDCSMNGISSRFSRLCVVNADGPFEPKDDCPAVLMQNHFRGCVRLVPAKLVDGKWVEIDGPGVGPMFGGNFGAHSDSRFNELASKLLGQNFYGAVAIHDRFE
jgi:hypothetical protein